MLQEQNPGQMNSGQNPGAGCDPSQNPYGVPQGTYGMPSNPPGVPPLSYGAPPLYANLPYQQSGGGMPPPAQAVPLPPGRALTQLPRQYLSVLTRPSAATFSEEMAKANWGSVWIQLLAFAFFSGLMVALLVLELLYLAVSGTKLSPSALYIGEIGVILITCVLGSKL